MISYKPLLKTLEIRGISTYKLITEYHISSSTIDRIRHDKPLNTTTIDDLCRICECGVGDVMEYMPDRSTSIDSGDDEKEL